MEKEIIKIITTDSFITTVCNIVLALCALFATITFCFDKWSRFYYRSAKWTNIKSSLGVYFHLQRSYYQHLKSADRLKEELEMVNIVNKDRRNEIDQFIINHIELADFYENERLKLIVSFEIEFEDYLYLIKPPEDLDTPELVMVDKHIEKYGLPTRSKVHKKIMKFIKINIQKRNNSAYKAYLNLG